MIIRFASLFALVLAVVSCDKPGAETTAPAPSDVVSAKPAASNAATGSSGNTIAPTAAPSASANAEVVQDKRLEGTWEGRFDAKKGDVEMPPRVKDKVRSKDDGKIAVGSGTITLTIGSNLEIEGKTAGALGVSALRGKVEGDDVRAMVTPNDPLDKQAMFGIVSGKHKDDKIDARIRVANGDATIVREADVVLRRKP